VSTASSQLLWVKYRLEDYSCFKNNIHVYCVNTSAINISKNLIQHSKAKHIEIRYNFIRNYVKKGTFDIMFIDIVINGLISLLNLCLKIILSILGNI